MTVPTLLAALGLALIHLFAGHLRFLEGIPRNRWLSAAGGVSVAYVFLHLLPELAEGQEVLDGVSLGPIGSLERHAYLLAFLGLAVFYGLERLAKTSGRRRRISGQVDSPGTAVFWLHIASFSLYNALIGYLLLHRGETSLRELSLFSVAMGLHFVVTDFGLRDHHQHDYTTRGRWVLSLAILVGWVLGIALEMPESTVVVLIALLAGGIILNVLKEELPDERQGRFSAFFLGGTAYAALLLAI